VCAVVAARRVYYYLTYFLAFSVDLAIANVIWATLKMLLLLLMMMMSERVSE